MTWQPFLRFFALAVTLFKLNMGELYVAWI